MTYEANAAVRSTAIKDLGRRLTKPNKPNNSTSLSQLLGDTQSLLTLFAQSSVADIKHLCVAISNSGRHGRQHQPGFKERQQSVERLLRALLPAIYPTEAASYHDGRPLQHLYATMLPACSAEFVETVLDARDQSNPLFRCRDVRKLMRSHPALFQKRAEDHLFGHTSEADPDVHRCIDSLLNHDKAFALSALHGRHDGTITKERWGGYSEVRIALSLVQRLVKRRQTSKDCMAMQIRDLVQLGLESIAAEPPTTRNNRKSDDVELWTFALNGWKRRPEVFEDALTLGLRLGLGSSPGSVPRDYFSAAMRPVFPEPQRQRLLQLYCLHVGKEGCDIFGEDASFAAIAKSPWPFEVFSHFDVEQSTRILEALEAVNGEYNFLEAPTSKISIFGLDEVAGQSNFNVGLLLTQLQRDDPNVIRKARDAVDGLRRKAAAAREPAVRAEFAHAASACAIATGDLDLYGDTIFWQQRFVRDPFAARRIFGRAAVLTVEGIDLLSAVKDLKGLEENISTMRIRKADDILKSFFEACCLAKREPSFQPSDWSSVTSLLGAVYEKRVQGLQNLCDAQIVIVWKSFLDSITWMDIGLLNRIYSPAMDLLKGLSPKHLATATQDLLRIGMERRKEQSRKLEDNYLERLSYEALKMLAKSNTPALASDLVVQTIIDRPDASSWHRELLSAGFLKRLRAKEAYEVLFNLARAINDKLEEQSYVRVGETEPAKHAPPQSMVKATTVKYLAQLLNNADFIPNETAVEVLVELTRNAQHRDIRLAALESLLSLLDRLCTEVGARWVGSSTVEAIMCALETVVPVVGSIDERRPLREEDWADAEATGVLPDIEGVVAGGLRMPPLMEVLLLAAEGTRYRGLKIMQSALVERIVLPILCQSQIEHGRWIKLFLAKYQAPFSASDVPRTPVAVYAWHRALASYYPLVAPAILADFDAYAVHQIAPDVRLRQFAAMLRADVELRKRADVQHWIRVFDYRVNSFQQSGTHVLVGLMKTHLDASLRVEYGPVIDIVFQHAMLLLDHYEEYAGVWETFMACLAPNLQRVRNAEHDRHWRDTQGRIVRRISDEISKRKTQESNHILPSRTKLELWLLPFLDINSGGDASAFVVQLENVLLGLLDGDGSQIFGWSDMADDTCIISDLIDGDDVKSMIACGFGKLTTREDMAAARVVVACVQTGRALDLIKVKVAMQLFDECKDLEMIKRAGTERLNEWRACGSDVIRERAFRWEGRRRIERAREGHHQR